MEDVSVHDLWLKVISTPLAPEVITAGPILAAVILSLIIVFIARCVPGTQSWFGRFLVASCIMALIIGSIVWVEFKREGWYKQYTAAARCAKRELRLREKAPYLRAILRKRC